MSGTAQFCATISVICGICFLLTSLRHRGPSLLAGILLIVNGVFVLSLPYLDAIFGSAGILLFSAWVLTFPLTLCAVITLVVRAVKGCVPVVAPISSATAFFLNLIPAFEFYVGASLGVV